MSKPHNHKERIDLSDNMMSVMMKLSAGNPGGLNVCMQLLQSKHDPDSAFGGLGNLLALDTHGIYGSNIWILFKDCCNSSILNVVTVLRAMQLGLVSEGEVWQHIDNCKPLKIFNLYQQVVKELPRFNSSAVSADPSW